MMTSGSSNVLWPGSVTLGVTTTSGTRTLIDADNRGINAASGTTFSRLPVFSRCIPINSRSLA